MSLRPVSDGSPAGRLAGCDRGVAVLSTVDVVHADPSEQQPFYG